MSWQSGEAKVWKEEARRAVRTTKQAALAKEKATLAKKDEASRLELVSEEKDTLAREEKASAAARAQRFEVSFPGVDSSLGSLLFVGFFADRLCILLGAHPSF